MLYGLSAAEMESLPTVATGGTGYAYSIRTTELHVSVKQVQKLCFQALTYKLALLEFLQYWFSLFSSEFQIFL